jgi:hypothetical protein
MRVFRGVLPLLLACLCASACQAPRSTLERALSADPVEPYRGMSKEEIAACAGAPSSSYSTNSGETLVYHYNGDGPVPGANKGAEKKKEGSSIFTKKSSGDWTCSASLVFEGGRLTRVTYAHRDVVSPYEQKRDPTTGKKEYVTPPEPCHFSLPNCVRR